MDIEIITYIVSGVFTIGLSLFGIKVSKSRRKGLDTIVMNTLMRSRTEVQRHFLDSQVAEFSLVITDLISTLSEDGVVDEKDKLVLANLTKGLKAYTHQVKDFVEKRRPTIPNLNVS
jgi:ABC-type glucose/galactose transport system permease subunit